MKIGCCTNMIATKPDGTGVEWIDALAEFGFDYIELPLSELCLLPEPEFEAVLKRVEHSGIRCEVCNNFFPRTLRLTGADVDEQAIDAYLQKALGRAYRLGVQRIVFGSGPAKNIPDGFPRDTAYRQIVALLRKISDCIAGHDLMIVIEPLNKAECNIINSFKEACGLAADVDRDNIRVLVDYYHLCAENEPDAHVAQQGKAYLRHVHFARYEGRKYPQDIDEDLGYASFFHKLQQAGYDERISIEAYTDNFMEQAPKTMKMIRGHFEKR